MIRLLIVTTALAGTCFAVPQPPLVNPNGGPTVEVTLQSNVFSLLKDGPSFVGAPSKNVMSPVAANGDLYIVDQNGQILVQKPDGTVNVALDVETDPPFGLDYGRGAANIADKNRQAIFSVSEGKNKNFLYVCLGAKEDPSTKINGLNVVYMPDPLNETYGFPFNRLTGDIYRLPKYLDFGAGTPIYSLITEFRIDQDTGKLTTPRAIVAFESQDGPTHNGGGMLTYKQRFLFFATGDCLPFGTSGRTSAQDEDEVCSKIFFINGASGSYRVAAKGVRNVQYMEYLASNSDTIGFGDIGGVTAEELDFVSATELRSKTNVDNFGWGTASDGKQREGTFFVEAGEAITGGTPATVTTSLPSIPEPGFIQPAAQYGRNDVYGGLAVSGPVSSTTSLASITAAFTDLNSGYLYTYSAATSAINQEIKLANLVDGDGNPIPSNTFNGLNLQPNPTRVDPRLFRYPNGDAGVLFENTGELYKLKIVTSN